jgi:UDPglucose--hexose-1-phosphate uridylyltransferase
VAGLTHRIDGPHRRYDPLADEWLLVSPGRTSRPWLGLTEPELTAPLPRYDPECYLCPGNVRAGGERNPDYRVTYQFTNDFPALQPSSPGPRATDGLLVAEGEAGTCRVLCFSPRHDLTLARMPEAEVRGVVDLWAEQSAELGTTYPWVQVFENRGSVMGASNPHPHGQVWAGSAVPTRALRELETQRRHHAATGNRLLLDYASQEAADGARRLESTDEWLVVVPFWAAWPFETLVIARRPAGRLPELDDSQRRDLAGVLRRLLARYDGLFDVPFPYSMGWHQAPFDAGAHPYWQLHAHVYPPLLRAQVRKFMVGYELLAEPQRDITPEQAAEALRAAGTPTGHVG